MELLKWNHWKEIGIPNSRQDNLTFPHKLGKDYLLIRQYVHLRAHVCMCACVSLMHESVHVVFMYACVHACMDAWVHIYMHA